MRHHRLPLLLLVLLGLLATACGGAAQSAETDPTAAPASGGLTTQETELGPVLADSDGLTLYGFTDDTDGVSTCYDACATTWPPVPGGQRAGDGITATLRPVARDDGSEQLAAGAIPLYTFAGDAAPGDVNGHNSGGVWFAVAPDGSLIDGPQQEAVASEAPTAPAAVPAVDGDVLTDADGLTLYYFRNDTDGTSACNSPCSDTWPPVGADEQVDTAALQLALLGATTRDDGAEQLTYDGRPLYRYIDDAQPGDVNGQGVGNVWFAAGADGTELAPEGVRLGSTDAGEVLVDGDGFTLYTFANDVDGTSACNDPCQATWPAVPGDASIDGATDGSAFGAITRDDGTQQLALGGQPLYRYVGDINPGDANGNGVGDVWFAVDAQQVGQAAGTGGGGGDAAADGAGDRAAAGPDDATSQTDVQPY